MLHGCRSLAAAAVVAAAAVAAPALAPLPPAAPARAAEPAAGAAAPAPGSRGLLDLPAPALAWVDRTVLGPLPVPARVAAWSLLAALLSMTAYRLTSRQAALAEVKREALETRRRLKAAEAEGELRDMWPLLRRNLALAGRQLGLTVVPALLASLPVLVVLAWMSNAFDARPPAPGDAVTVTLVPAPGRELPPVAWRGGGRAAEVAPGTWSVAWPEEGRSVALHGPDGGELLSLPTAAPARAVEQRRWWNVLIGNPAGYLPPGRGELDAVLLELPRPEVLPLGPSWARGWLPAALLLIVAGSLLLKALWRLH